jgi:hypothetical protein
LVNKLEKNMTIDEVKILLGRKIDQAEIDRLEALARKEWEVETYYSGVKEGLQQAKQVIGMLHSNHNHLKK